MLILEVNPSGSEYLQGYVNIVDLLQTTDCGHPQLTGQAPVLDEQLHHTPDRKTCANNVTNP